MPDHPLYIKAVEALKRYHQAQAEGVSGTELERLKLMAEHCFQAATDYQLRALGGRQIGATSSRPASDLGAIDPLPIAPERSRA